jgi:type I restriction enzyme S subunit
LDGLRELKRGHLQLIFPQAGERVPRVRFAGFTEDWQERRLGEIAEFNPRSIIPDSFEYVDLESVVGTSLITHRTEEKDTAPSRAQRLAKKGDVFFQTVRPYQRNNYLFELPVENFVFSTGYAQLRPKINSHFLFCLLQEEKFVAMVLDNCTGTSYPAINSNDLAGVEVKIPIEANEQTAIGAYFQNLEKQITIHVSKLEQLRQLKAAYLQRMFV